MYDVLQRTPLEYYDEFSDKVALDMYLNSFEEDLGNPPRVRAAVNTLCHDYEESMYDNGMEKFVAVIAGMLFEMKYNEVDPDLAYEANWDIRDFETGNYDDLFTPEDLVLLKADVKTVKDYLLQNPELPEDDDGGPKKQKFERVRG